MSQRDFLVEQNISNFRILGRLSLKHQVWYECSTFEMGEGGRPLPTDRDGARHNIVPTSEPKPRHGIHWIPLFIFFCLSRSLCFEQRLSSAST